MTSTPRCSSIPAPTPPSSTRSSWPRTRRCSRTYGARRDATGTVRRRPPNLPGALTRARRAAPRGARGGRDRLRAAHARRARPEHAGDLGTNAITRGVWTLDLEQNTCACGRTEALAPRATTRVDAGTRDCVAMARVRRFWGRGPPRRRGSSARAPPSPWRRSLRSRGKPRRWRAGARARAPSSPRSQALGQRRRSPVRPRGLQRVARRARLLLSERSPRGELPTPTSALRRSASPRRRLLVRPAQGDARRERLSAHTARGRFARPRRLSTDHRGARGLRGHPGLEERSVTGVFRPGSRSRSRCARRPRSGTATSETSSSQGRVPPRTALGEGGGAAAGAAARASSSTRRSSQSRVPPRTAPRGSSHPLSILPSAEPNDRRSLGPLDIVVIVLPPLLAAIAAGRESVALPMHRPQYSASARRAALPSQTAACSPRLASAAASARTGRARPKVTRVAPTKVR